MAKRRMFSLDIVDTDDFLDMPASTQNLYFHLGMRADDDGFVSSPRKITKIVNCSTDDLKLLITKGFIIPFDSGICVIRDWKQNNYIQSDRYHPTIHLDEKKLIGETEAGQFFLMEKNCVQNVSKVDTEVKLGEDRLKQGKSKGRKEKKSLTNPDGFVCWAQDARRASDPDDFDQENPARALYEEYMANLGGQT